MRGSPRVPRVHTESTPPSEVSQIVNPIDQGVPTIPIASTTSDVFGAEPGPCSRSTPRPWHRGRLKVGPGDHRKARAGHRRRRRRARTRLGRPAQRAGRPRRSPTPHPDRTWLSGSSNASAPGSSFMATDNGSRGNVCLCSTYKPSTPWTRAHPPSTKTVRSGPRADQARSHHGTSGRSTEGTTGS